MDNIINLKKFNNLKESGLALLDEFLHSFFGCVVRFQHLPISKFEEHFAIDIHSNVNRNCYRINENKMAIVVKVFGKEKESIIAVMPIVLEGENISNVANALFENLAIVISKKMTECYRNSFHGGTKIFGDELPREYISVCLAAKQYDYSRILFLLEFFEKLAATTFEGKYFTTGLIVSRSLYDYNGKNGANRFGKLSRIYNEVDLIKKPIVDKRFWYLIDGVNSFYVADQTLVIKNTFTRDKEAPDLIRFFDSYFLKNTLHGVDIAFRVIGPNEVSIITNKGIEFIKIENKWRIRDFGCLSKYLDERFDMAENVRSAIIYYMTLCSKNHCSSILWIPNDESENVMNDVVSSKNQMWEKNISILDDKNELIIHRILSSDGVTIISKNGNILYYGAIVRLEVKNKTGLTGTGENAAKILSQNGVAIKISQDGNIKIYAGFDVPPLVY